MNPYAGEFAADPSDFEEEPFADARRVGQLVGQQIYKPWNFARRVVDVDDGEHLHGEQRLVAAALADPRWQFRTADGIAAATGLALAVIERTLERGDISRRPYGRPHADLYTARGRPISLRERLSLWSSFVAKRPL